MFEVQGLSKYFGGLAAVSNLDFSINKGELVGLIGPNGSGKTTTFNLITGYYRPNAGKIILEGNNLAGRKPYYVASKGIVRTFQGNNLFNDFTVLQNVLAACHLKTKMGFFEGVFRTPGSRRKEAVSLKRTMDILQMVGLDISKDILAKNLPHKHKRILGIAMTLAADPKLLLLDEPLSGMNAEEVVETCDLIRQIWQNGTTILLIEHNMRAAMSLCQRIVVINFGKKIAEGLPGEIQENKQVIEAYLGASKNVTKP